MPLPPSFATRYGPFALVTGATTVIGAHFVRLLSSYGIRVVMVDTNMEFMQKLAEEVHSTQGVRSILLHADMSQRGVAQIVTERVRELDVGLLVHCADEAQHGSFLSSSVENNLNLIDVNVSAPMVLSSVLGKKMAQRGKGGIIFMSATMSRPLPYFAMYGASKNFTAEVAAVLHHELMKRGVDVLSVEQAKTPLQMARHAAEGDLYNLAEDDEEASAIVERALYKLGRVHSFVPHASNRILKSIVGALPRSLFMSVSDSIVKAAMKRQEAPLLTV